MILLLTPFSISFAAPPQRIVATSPSVTETLFALGLGDRVIGVCDHCGDPPQALAKARIGPSFGPNLDAIALLHPDLVVIPANPSRLADRLGAMRLRALEVDQHDLNALYSSLFAIGAATEAGPQAAALTQSMRARIERVRARAAGLTKVRTLAILGRTPQQLDGLIAAGPESYVDELLAAAGGKNVIHDAPPQTLITLQQVIDINPDVILDLAPENTPANQSSVMALWQTLASAPAIQRDRIFPISGSVFLVPGPRSAEAAERLFQLLHPDAR